MARDKIMESVEGLEKIAGSIRQKTLLAQTENQLAATIFIELLYRATKELEDARKKSIQATLKLQKTAATTGKKYNG